MDRGNSFLSFRWPVAKWRMTSSRREWRFVGRLEAEISIHNRRSSISVCRWWKWTLIAVYLTTNSINSDAVTLCSTHRTNDYFWNRKIIDNFTVIFRYGRLTCEPLKCAVEIDDILRWRHAFNALGLSTVQLVSSFRSCRISTRDPFQRSPAFHSQSSRSHWF